MEPTAAHFFWHLTEFLAGLVFFICLLESAWLALHKKNPVILPVLYGLSAFCICRADQLPQTLLLIPSATLLTSTWWFKKRFNGGADSMLFLWSLMFVYLHSGTGGPSDSDVKLILLAMSIIGAGSYFVAGWVKWKNPEWRSGQALLWSLQQGCYKTPFSDSAFIRRHCKEISFGIIAWELSFPLALTHPLSAVFFVFTGFIFHGVNLGALGLNRFFWSWVIYYPAILYVAFSSSLTKAPYF